MKKNKNIIINILLIIVIALSMLLFFGIENTTKSGIQISSFVFIIVTELIIYFNVLIILNKKLNTFTIAGLSSSTFIYSICSIVFNIILISIFQTVKNILVFNFSILLVYAFIVAIIMLLKKESN